MEQTPEIACDDDVHATLGQVDGLGGIGPYEVIEKASEGWFSEVTFLAMYRFLPTNTVSSGACELHIMGLVEADFVG